MRKQQNSFLFRSVSLGLLLLCATTARGEWLAVQDRSPDSFAASSMLEGVRFTETDSLVDVGQSESWRLRIGELAESAPSDLETKEFHPAPEPSGLLLALIAVFGASRLCRKR